MKLNAQDYDLLIKRYARDIGVFGMTEGTSLSFEYLKAQCARLVEITIEYQTNFPKEAKRFSDGE